MPIGALADISGDDMRVRGVVVAPDGTRIVRATASGPTSDAEAVGAKVAEELLRGGAGEILSDVQRAHAAVEGIQP